MRKEWEDKKDTNGDDETKRECTERGRKGGERKTKKKLNNVDEV